MSNEDNALISSANAWKSFDKWFSKACSSDARLRELATEVSNELFRDGCHSAWVHKATLIERLLARIVELEEEVEYLEVCARNNAEGKL